MNSFVDNRGFMAICEVGFFTMVRMRVDRGISGMTTILNSGMCDLLMVVMPLLVVAWIV